MRAVAMSQNNKYARRKFQNASVAVTPAVFVFHHLGWIFSDFPLMWRVSQALMARPSQP